MEDLEDLLPVLIPPVINSLHRELIEAAFRCVREGLPEKTAAQFLGVPWPVWRKWKQVGNNKIKRGRPCLESAFVMALSRAEAELQYDYIDTLHGRHGDDDERPKMKMNSSQILSWLAQRWPAVYGAVAIEDAAGEQAAEKKRGEAIRQIKERLAARKADKGPK